MMYCIVTDHPPGLIGSWAHLDQCHRYADKLRAKGWEATVKAIDFPVTIKAKHQKPANSLVRRRRLVRSSG